jgi:hypothetical protein
MKSMKSNEELQLDVQDAIKWQPLLKAAEIGVTAKDGIVTLSGTVNSFTKKMEAENAAKSVIGVKAVVEEIDVDFVIDLLRNDDLVWSADFDAIRLPLADVLLSMVVALNAASEMVAVIGSEYPNE